MRKSGFYIIELFRHNRLAGCIVCIFFLINFAANFLTPTQISPIYSWNLYAYPIATQETYTFLDVRYNNDVPLDIKRTWREPQRLILTDPLFAYVRLQIYKKPSWVQAHFENNWKAAHPRFMKVFPHFKNYNSEKELSAFPSWFHKYLQTYTGTVVDSFKIYRRDLYFTKQGAVQERSSTLIYRHP